MKTLEELAEEFAFDHRFSEAIELDQIRSRFDMRNLPAVYADQIASTLIKKAFLAGYAAAKSEEKGLVASAMRRQGMDPTKHKTNNAEITAISGKRFEEDV